MAQAPATSRAPPHKVLPHLNPYTPLKLAWWVGRERLPRAPKQAQVVLSDLCNQDCHFCAYRMTGYSSNQRFAAGHLAKYGHNNPVRMMDAQRALSLMNELALTGVRAVQFTGGGEPTVHPRHVDIFERALSLGLKCALVTNGVKMSEELIALLPRFSWLRVSLDAGCADTYAKTRNTPRDNFTKVIGNIARSVDECRQSKCVIGVGFVVTPENYLEIIEACRIAKATGARYIRLSAVFSNEDAKPFADIFDAVKEEIRLAKNECQSPRFDVVDLFGDRLDDLTLGNPDYQRCGYQHFTTYIGADMQAYRCCVYSYNDRGAIAGGDLRERRFEEFWPSKERQEDFANFDARGCERCQFNDKNRTINYMLDQEPLHVEFP